MICLKVINKEGSKIAENAGDIEVNLVVEHQYEEGDMICIKPEEVPGYYWLQIDDALGKSLVYMIGEQSYEIPFSEKRMNISYKTFSGNVHLLSMRKAKQFEIENYRNLACNVNDQHGDVKCYPHAYANVETRGESVFAAKNAIDGVTANVDHGNGHMLPGESIEEMMQNLRWILEEWWRLIGLLFIQEPISHMTIGGYREHWNSQMTVI